MTKDNRNTEEKDTINCPHCGGKHKASARFCTKTGKALVVIPIDIKPEKAEIGEIFVSDRILITPPPQKEETVTGKKAETTIGKTTVVPVIAEAVKPVISLQETGDAAGKAIKAKPDFTESKDKTTSHKSDSKKLKLRKKHEHPTESNQKNQQPSSSSSEQKNVFQTVEIAVKRCHNCGTPFSKPDARFCIACGARVPVFDASLEAIPTSIDLDQEPVPIPIPEIQVKEPQQKAPPPLLCPNPDCKEPIEDHQKYCKNCYHRLEKCTSCGKHTDIWRDKCQFCKSSVNFTERNWLQFKGDSARTGNTTEEIAIPLERKWTYPDPRGMCPVLSSPVIYKGNVYFGSSDMQLHAVNQYTGNPVWKKPTKGVITSTPAIFNDIIYTASGDGRVYAVEAKSGGPVWVFPDRGRNGDGIGKITAGILACESGVFFVNTSGDVFRLEPETGKLIWKISTDSDYLESTDGEETGAEQTSAPALMGGDIYIATRGGRLYCLDVETGAEKWRFPAESHLASRFVSTPALCNKLCYIPDRSGKFYALSAKTGEDAWADTVDLDGVVEGSPSIGFGKIFAGTQTQWFIALNLHSGGELWRERNDKIRIFDYIFSTPTVTKNGLVFYGSNSGYIYCRDINTGEELWRSSKLDSPIRSAPAISDGYLYITTTGGFLYAFREKKD